MTTRLRDLVGTPGRAMVLPGVANALTAVIAADVGFEAVYLTGAGVTNAELALPDLGFVTLDEIASQVGKIRDATDVAVVVDADTGFGNALNVVRTVRVLERSGANAIQLEDQDFPKRCGHFSGKVVVPLEEMAAKVAAAVDARTSDDFLVIARTDALAVFGMDEALRRADAYAEAGADVIFVEALTTREEIEEVARHVTRPLLINMVEGGRTPLVETDELEALGYRVVLYANAALRASMLATQRVLGALRATRATASVQDEIVSWEERQRLVGKDRWDELERRYSS